MKRIVLTGGGTAGHVTPNLALIPRLLEDGGRDDGKSHRPTRTCSRIPQRSFLSFSNTEGTAVSRGTLRPQPGPSVRQP